MRSFAPAARPVLLVVLVAAGIGAALPACEANLETVCYDGEPCVPPEETATTTSKTTTTTAAAKTDIPCDVWDILVAKCHLCHNENHDNGAPIDLFDCGRFHEDECSGLGLARYERASQFVTSGAMPAGPTDLTDEEKTVVLGWLDGGAECLEKGQGCSATPGTKACYE